MRDAGMFYASAGARPGVPLDEVEALFMDEIARVAEFGVTAEEVDRAKRQMEVSLINRFATNHSLASRVGREIVAFGRVRSLSERVAAIRAVTPKDIQRVVATYLTQEGLNVIRVVPPPPDLPVTDELATATSKMGDAK